MLWLQKESEGTICTSVCCAQRSNSLPSVCIWIGALISKLYLHWAFMAQLGVQMVLWHRSRSQSSPVNSVALLHLEGEKKKWKCVDDHCVLRQGFSDVAADLLTSPLCHLLDFQQPPAFRPWTCCRPPSLANGGSQPHDRAYPPHVCSFWVGTVFF